MSEKILCQGKSCKTGCHSCGGYGVLIQRENLDCGHYIWTRPYAITVYDGKEFRSIDGLDCIYKNGKYLCLDCYEKGLVEDMWHKPKAGE